MNFSPIKIIAHRGSSFEAPENTISAVQLAIDENADAIEIDIHLTKDKKIVVIHDSNIKRTAGIYKKIKNLTLEELQEFDFGSWKGDKWKNEKIPTLKQIFSIVPKKKTIFIEIKSGPECLDQIKIIVEKLNVSTSSFVIMDFNFDTVVKAKKMFPDVEVLWLYEFNFFTTSSKKRKLLNSLINKTIENKIDGLNIENVKELDDQFIKKVKENNLKCYCWTVDNYKRAKYLIESGIDGVTTNRPGWMKSKLNLK